MFKLMINGKGFDVKHSPQEWVLAVFAGVWNDQLWAIGHWLRTSLKAAFQTFICHQFELLQGTFQPVFGLWNRWCLGRIDDYFVFSLPSDWRGFRADLHDSGVFRGFEITSHRTRASFTVVKLVGWAWQIYAGLIGDSRRLPWSVLLMPASPLRRHQGVCNWSCFSAISMIQPSLRCRIRATCWGPLAPS